MCIDTTRHTNQWGNLIYMQLFVMSIVEHERRIPMCYTVLSHPKSVQTRYMWRPIRTGHELVFVSKHVEPDPLYSVWLPCWFGRSSICPCFWTDHIHINVGCRTHISSMWCTHLNHDGVWSDARHIRANNHHNRCKPFKPTGLLDLDVPQQLIGVNTHPHVGTQLGKLHNNAGTFNHCFQQNMLATCPDMHTYQHVCAKIPRICNQISQNIRKHHMPNSVIQVLVTLAASIIISHNRSIYMTHCVDITMICDIRCIHAHTHGCVALMSGFVLTVYEHMHPNCPVVPGACNQQCTTMHTLISRSHICPSADYPSLSWAHQQHY